MPKETFAATLNVMISQMINIQWSILEIVPKSRVGSFKEEEKKLLQVTTNVTFVQFSTSMLICHLC